MSHVQKPMRVTQRIDNDGVIKDHSWVRVHQHKLSALVGMSTLPPAAIELVLYQMTCLKFGSATVAPWINATVAATLNRDADTISACLTALQRGDVVRKRRVHGAVHLELDPELAFRGSSSRHLATLERSAGTRAARPWIKLFVPAIVQLIDTRMPGSQMRVMLQLIALVAAGSSTTPPLGPTQAAANAIRMSRAGWASALRSLEDGGFIARTGCSNTSQMTVNPRYAFHGRADERLEALHAWDSRRRSRIDV
ncbi:hypothetical protein [Cellulomonas timonensis]|uniref:hypothetical protein n=1 Tax=Cellulomonas timonensis TaxID=1689271 RepID=UPI000829DC0E|nr:hypothetical protein [Cellulomonas timonensis]